MRHGQGRIVSVPFTSGSSLQPFSNHGSVSNSSFQFPLHRDPRCNVTPGKAYLIRPKQFQFPLHRDPRCNCRMASTFFFIASVSVPFTSGSSLQRLHVRDINRRIVVFQFPLHRDPRCNWHFTQAHLDILKSFSSLYIGILAATGRRGCKQC